MSPTTVSNKKSFDAMRALARRTPAPERCELCSVTLPGIHPHLLELSTRRIVCACDACAILFNHRDETRNLVRLPRDIRRLDGFRIPEFEWAALRLPIDLAFFLNNASAGRTLAFYPSPGGCTESLLDLEAWQDVVRMNPALDAMSPDVEALLANRTRGREQYYIVPLDECYRLTGLIRTHWRGLSGGEEVWHAIDEFFESLRARAGGEDRAHA
jgi:hypothetical protein